MAWELAGARYLSELAADKNVRAPTCESVAVLKIGRRIQH
jgi:hypothetical protein